MVHVTESGSGVAAGVVWQGSAESGRGSAAGQRGKRQGSNRLQKPGSQSVKYKKFENNINMSPITVATSK